MRQNTWVGNKYAVLLIRLVMMEELVLWLLFLSVFVCSSEDRNGRDTPISFRGMVRMANALGAW